MTPIVCGVVLAAVIVVAVEQNSKQRPGTRERNDRIFGVPVNAPKFNGLKEVRDLESRVRDELEAFFMAAVAFEGKDLKLLQWAGASAAYDLVKTSIAVAS